MAATTIICDGLLAALAADINSAHRQACESLRRGLDHARRAGELLIRVKDQLPTTIFLANRLGRSD